MKTPEEIKKGLECHAQACGCEMGCPYTEECGEDEGVPACRDALAYIQQLEQELAAVKRERDAAVEDIAMRQCCETCLYCDIPARQNPCISCYGYNLWKWRGVCPENTEVQEDDQ